MDGGQPPRRRERPLQRLSHARRRRADGRGARRGRWRGGGPRRVVQCRTRDRAGQDGVDGRDEGPGRARRDAEAEGRARPAGPDESRQGHPLMAAVATIRRDPVLRPVAAALFALGAGIGSYAPYQSLIATGGLGIGNRAYAAVLVIASLVAAGGAVSIGILSDRRGNRRRLAAASAVSWLAGPVLMTFYPSQASFVLAHALFIPLGGTLFGQFFVLARIAAARHPAAERAGIQASIRAAFAAPFILILP
ncbi:MAG: MFS transporter, partial [Thermoleophilia bacterium]|nr:MFS transporter [Thermoleophilia bacterium]